MDSLCDDDSKWNCRHSLNKNASTFYYKRRSIKILLFQELTEFFHSTSTVANGILDIIT